MSKVWLVLKKLFKPPPPLTFLAKRGPNTYLHDRVNNDGWDSGSLMVGGGW